MHTRQEEDTRSNLLLALWRYIKKRKLHDPENITHIKFDGDDLAKFFRPATVRTISLPRLAPLYPPPQFLPPSLAPSPSFPSLLPPASLPPPPLPPSHSLPSLPPTLSPPSLPPILGMVGRTGHGRRSGPVAPGRRGTTVLNSYCSRHGTRHPRGLGRGGLRVRWTSALLWGFGRRGLGFAHEGWGMGAL